MDKIEEILNSPDAMSKVLDMAQSIMGESATTPSPTPDAFQGLDPKIITTLGSVMQEFNRDDDRRLRFLNSLRPYMGEHNAPQIDKAVQIMRISRVIRHLFKNFGGGSNV